MGTTLLRIYLVLLALSICVFVAHGRHPFAALFLLILTLPWSALAAFPMVFLGVTEVGRLFLILFLAALNARLLYRLGEKLE